MMLLRHATAEGLILTLEVCAGAHQQWALFHIAGHHFAVTQLCTMHMKLEPQLAC